MAGDVSKISLAVLLATCVLVFATEVGKSKDLDAESRSGEGTEYDSSCLDKVDIYESDKYHGSASQQVCPTKGLCPESTIDAQGYILFCLCMGRFGNQADHFLGGLAWAKQMNRTLVLPSWRTDRNLRFDQFFKIEPLTHYHRVVVAEDFMNTLAPRVWPPESRIGMCAVRNVADKCRMKDGNPFGPFWDSLGVNFVDEIGYPFTYADLSRFNSTFPASKYPVIALKGAPASFPVRDEYKELQKYLKWSDHMMNTALGDIKRLFGAKKFVGIHLRNGKDWENACKDVERFSNYMASPQCLGPFAETGDITHEMCLPSENEVVRLTTKVVKEENAKFVYVATDRNPMLKALEEALHGFGIKVVHLDPFPPQIDLIILGQADHFIGNCVSSFTSFVKRERDVNKKPTSFFGFTK